MDSSRLLAGGRAREVGTEVISAQGGTTDTYALLTFVPTKNVAVVVVADSYSQFVSNLGECMLDMVVPELSLPAARPAR